MPLKIGYQVGCSLLGNVGRDACWLSSWLQSSGQCRARRVLIITLVAVFWAMSGERCVDYYVGCSLLDNKGRDACWLSNWLQSSGQCQVRRVLIITLVAVFWAMSGERCVDYYVGCSLLDNKGRDACWLSSWCSILGNVERDACWLSNWLQSSGQCRVTGVLIIKLIAVFWAILSETRVDYQICCSLLDNVGREACWLSNWLQSFGQYRARRVSIIKLVAVFWIMSGETRVDYQIGCSLLDNVRLEACWLSN